MKWFIIAASALLILVIVIASTTIKVLLDYKHFKNNDHLKVEIRGLFGLIKYKINLPIIKMDGEDPAMVLKSRVQKEPVDSGDEQVAEHLSSEELLKGIKDVKKILNHVVDLHAILRWFLKRVHVTGVEWHTIIGTGDAAGTGIVTGVVWALKSGIVGLIYEYMLVKEQPVITVTPNFQYRVNGTVLKCMIKFRAGHAMVAGIRLAKYWKGRKPQFSSRPLSVLSSEKTKSV